MFCLFFYVGVFRVYVICELLVHLLHFFLESISCAQSKSCSKAKNKTKSKCHGREWEPEFVRSHQENFELEGQEQKIKGTACLHVLFAPKDENCIKKIEISGNFPICQAYMR